MPAGISPGYGFLAPRCLLGTAPGMVFLLYDARWDQPRAGLLAPRCLLGSAPGRVAECSLLDACWDQPRAGFSRLLMPAGISPGQGCSLLYACWDQPQACLCGTFLGSARSATMYVSHRQVFILLVGRSIVVRINNLDFYFSTSG
jgi:hypothetical protein